MPPKLLIQFDAGSLLFENLGEELKASLETICELIYDKRVSCYRCPAHFYKEIIVKLHQLKHPFEDTARCYSALNTPLAKTEIEPRNHQSQALSKWLENERCGVVVLPTGAGKTILAILAILAVKRSTLIVVPTIDLMEQWRKTLETYLLYPSLHFVRE